MIRSQEDLAHALGLGIDASEREFSREVYRHTTCGAWASLISPGRRKVGTKREKWTAHVQKSISGVFVSRARQDHRAMRWGRDVPDHIADYLLVDRSHRTGCKMDITWDELQRLEEFTTDSKFPEIMGTVRFELDAPRYRRHRGGIAIGSIVEGVDRTTQTHELLYPFRMKRFWEAIADVEYEAQEIWDDTHGCESCRSGEIDGLKPVDYECEACQGSGIPI